MSFELSPLENGLLASRIEVLTRYQTEAVKSTGESGRVARVRGVNFPFSFFPTSRQKGSSDRVESQDHKETSEEASEETLR